MNRDAHDSMPNRGLGVLAVVGVAVVGTALVSQVVSGGVAYRHELVPDQPCKSANGPGPCFWDAGRSGNGRGDSFWMDGHGQVTYLDPRAVRDEPAVREPYGGCDEAWQAPHSEGADLCRELGWVIRRHSAHKEVGHEG